MRSVPQLLAIAVAAFIGFWGGPVEAQEFDYHPPGELPDGSGTGLVDYEVYVPGMRFPIEESPAFANSQVWGHGGVNGPGGGQCDDNNYSYPWRDNYCETRQWDMPLCPSGEGHQGQDIRPATCTDKAHWAVAAEDGTITSIGTYSVYLTTADGTLHRYLHMDPDTLAVAEGDAVQQGERLGLVSNAFGGTPTTIHLHYDIRRALSDLGQTYIPTYMSLVRSYQALIGESEEPCGIIGGDPAIIDVDDPCFRLLGNVGTWRSESAGHDGQLHWTYAYDGDDADGYARWTLHFETAGNYDLEVYIDDEFADSTDAYYAVNSAVGAEEYRLDQSAASGWTTLGNFDFDADEQYWVEIYDNTGEPLSENLRIVVDAMRITPVALAGGDDGGGDDAGPGDVEDAGGDAGPVDSGSVDGGADDVDQGPAPQRFNETMTTTSCAQTPSAPPVMVWVLAMMALIVCARQVFGSRRNRWNLLG